MIDHQLRGVWHLLQIFPVTSHGLEGKNPLLTERNNVELLGEGLDGGKRTLTRMQNVWKKHGEVWSWIIAPVLKAALLFSRKRIKDKEILWLRAMDTQGKKEQRDKEKRCAPHNMAHDHDPFDCYSHCTEVLLHNHLLTHRIFQNKDYKIKLEGKNAPYLFCFFVFNISIY